MMLRMMLRDDQWEKIEKLIPGKKGECGRPATNNRQFVEAVIWIARTGSPWRFASWVWSVEHRLYPICTLVRQEGVAQHLCSATRRSRIWRSIFGQYGGTCAPARCGCCQKKGEQALGRSRGGLTTKIHVCVEGLGQAFRFILTGGAMPWCDASRPHFGLLSNTKKDSQFKTYCLSFSYIVIYQYRS